MDRKLLQYFINSETSPELSRILRFGISSWLDNKPMVDTKILVENASKTLEEAVVNQTTIGWENVFKGRLSITWSELYNHDLKNKKNEKKHMTADKWGKDLILILWDFVYDSWTCRNEVEHDTNEGPIKARKEKIVQHIQWLVQKSTMCQKHLYHKNKQNTLSKLPINNLIMMEQQLSNLAKTEKKYMNRSEEISLDQIGPDIVMDQ